MNRIYMFLGLSVSFILCLIIIWISLKAYFKAKKRIKELEASLENQKKNLIYIVRHAQELADIGSSQSKIDKEISGAKTDEEIVDIINTVINLNNAKLRNNNAE